MRFAPRHGNRRGPARWPAARGLARALLACCAVVAVSSMFPWVEIAFARLWGAGFGPRAVETRTGLTCLLVCVMAAMLVSFEGRSTSSREAARSGSLVLMAAAAVFVGRHIWLGPGMLRGVTAMHSTWFYAAASAVLLGTVFAALRTQRANSIRKRG